MTEPIVVRPATEADAPAVLRCLAAAFAPYEAEYSREGYLDTVLTPATLRRRMQTMRVLVADAGDSRVVGTIAYHVTAPGHGHLRGMAVLPAWAGRGVAPVLLGRAEEQLAAKGCSIVSLETTAPLLRAMAFYEKHGYARSGRVSDFFGMPVYEFVKDLRAPGWRALKHEQIADTDGPTERKGDGCSVSSSQADTCQDPNQAGT